VQAAGGRLPARWLDGVLHRLKHQGPHRVLTHLSWVATRYPSPGVQEKLASLQKREAHMQYPTYQAAGWPIGSGSVESATKGVVEARLKGAGMRLRSPHRQPHAGAAQCRLQSAVEPDVDSSGDAATRTARESATGREPAASDLCLVDPRLLGSTAFSALSSLWSSCHLTDHSDQHRASRSSSWLWLFLAQTLSQTPSFHPCGSRRGGCKKMKRTRSHGSFTLVSCHFAR
jgi:hypothetical protein